MDKNHYISRAKRFQLIQDRTQTLQLFLLSCALVSISFLWQGNIDFHLSDEGFLWYGVQRVLLGEIPTRDFMSYDPGRYYWSAAFMGLWGDNGIMALRKSVAILQALALFAGLYLITFAKRKEDFLYVLLAALTLGLWMWPYFKIYDVFLSIILIGALTFQVQNYSLRGWFFVGLCIGLVAVAGRNHGLYGAIGSIGVMVLLSDRQTVSQIIKGFSLWTAGICIGYLPIIVMILVVPNFAVLFWERFLFLLERGSTNIPLPIPWPWNVDYSLSVEESVRGFLIGLFFIALLIVGVLAIGWIIFKKIHNQTVHPVFTAASFLMLPYAHHAYSRADIAHLAQGIFPLLFGLIVFFSWHFERCKWPFIILLCTASFWVMHIYHPGWRYYSSGNQYEKVTIADGELMVAPGTARVIELLDSLVSQYAPNGRSFLVAPFWPGAYALFERKSPIYSHYALWPRNEDFQRREIQRLAESDPGFVFIVDHPLDGREELRFINAYPLVYTYIVSNFDVIPHDNIRYLIYSKRL